jgi:hypothetical protein
MSTFPGLSVPISCRQFESHSIPHDKEQKVRVRTSDRTSELRIWTFTVRVQRWSDWMNRMIRTSGANVQQGKKNVRSSTSVCTGS